MPKFTIGIPTWNRSHLLKRAISSALDQSVDDVEVVVCDDGSPDDTAEVARTFGDRIRFFQNPKNLGATANFERVFELATSPYFSWLQDDDMIHRDFVRRALDAFALDEAVAGYACYSVKTPSPTTFYHSFLTGPAVPAGWMQGGYTLMDGVLVAAPSLFYSFGNPPALAYRSPDLKRAIATIRHRCILFDERILLAGTVIEGKVAVDPWPGAIFSDHDNQDYKRIFREQPEARTSQWYILADAIGDLLQGRGDGWKAPIRQYFSELPLEYRLNWLRYYCPEVDAWRKANPIASEVWGMLVETVPPESRPAYLNPASSVLLLRGRTKTLVKEITPPVIWNLFRKRMQLSS